MLRNTKTLLGRCVYCGKEALEDFEYEDRTRYDYQFCDCETAKREIDIYNQIDDLQNKIPTEDLAVSKRIKFEAEMKKIQRDYPDYFKNEKE